MFLSANVNATDRVCAQYSTSEALAATSDSSTNTVSFVFSGMTARKGTTNADCAAASAESAQETPAGTGSNHSGGMPEPSVDKFGNEVGGDTTGSGTQTTGGNENSSQETGGSETSGSVSPTPQTPEEEHNCPAPARWYCDDVGCSCAYSG